jgi:hypothetical protein
LAARNATRDLFVSFVKVLQTRRRNRANAARKEGMRLLAMWFQWDKDLVLINGPVTQEGRQLVQKTTAAENNECTGKSGYKTQEEQAAEAIKCAGRTEMTRGSLPDNGRDSTMGIWFDWSYKSKAAQRQRSRTEM